MSAPKNNFAIQAPSLVGTDPCAFSWTSELGQIFSPKFFKVIWWPAFRYRQRYFTNTVYFNYCKTLPVFPDLWNTIQKGSFAYNSLFLGIRPHQKASFLTDLADITTLTLFFGDEFIDGICASYGKPSMQSFLNGNPDRFRLRKKISGEKVTLEYQYDLSRLLPPAVMQGVNEKYGISYIDFYYLIQFFLQQMNEHLSRLPMSRANPVADKILDVCNTCLESYVHDVNTVAAGEQIREVSSVLHFHETKTWYMQKKLLELRCILTGREELMDTPQAQGWLDIMRVVQIYDDIQDVLDDDGFQDNLVISVAYHYFPGEWKWFTENRELFRQVNQTSVLLSVFMPCTLHYCMQLAADKIRTMEWEQQKIMHYLVFRKNSSIDYDSDDPFELLGIRDRGNFLQEFYKKVSNRMPHLNNIAIRSYVIDACCHIYSVRKLLLRKSKPAISYRLRYDLFIMPNDVKARVFDELAG